MSLELGYVVIHLLSTKLLPVFVTGWLYNASSVIFIHSYVATYDTAV